MRFFSQTTKMSVEEILQNWEEKQKENAQIIQEEQEKARAERERQEAKKGGRGREHSPR